MIEIKKHTEGDSRVAKELPTFHDFTIANYEHIEDVMDLVLQGLYIF